MSDDRCKWGRNLGYVASVAEANRVINDLSWALTEPDEEKPTELQKDEILRIHNILCDQSAGWDSDDIDDEETEALMILPREDWAIVRKWTAFQTRIDDGSVKEAEPDCSYQGWEIDMGLEDDDMCGGDLEIKNLQGDPIELSEEDFTRMDRIQVHFHQFETVNLMDLHRRAGEAINQLGDEGFVDRDTNAEIRRVFARSQMFHNLTAALGRVASDDTEVRFLTLDEIGFLLEGLWTQDYGRAGARNRWMGELATQVQEQRDAFKDVREFEGETLPSRVPIVLAQGEWSQIDEDWMEQMLEGDFPTD